MNCAKCGTPNAESGNFCVSCGAPLAPSATSSASAPEPVYGDFWRRFLAYIVDYVALVIVAGVLLIVATFSRNQGAAGNFATVFIVVLGPWLYYALFESSSAQATPGKIATRIKVTDLKGDRLSFLRATGRFFAKWVSSMTFGIGFIMAGFTKRRQGLHDMIAGTLVVRADAEPAAVATARPLGPPSFLAVCLMVLICFIPIFGILAAIAIPAYQDYTIRSQVTEGLAFAADYKAAVAEGAANGLAFDELSSESLGLPVDPEGLYVEKIEVIEGAIAITYGKSAHPQLQGRTLALVPAIDSLEDVVWICGYARSPAGVTDVFENHWEFTDVEPKHLPLACREQ